MTGVLICAAVGVFVSATASATPSLRAVAWNIALGLALIAVALWLAYAAGTLTNRNHDMTNPNDTPVRSYDR